MRNLLGILTGENEIYCYASCNDWALEHIRLIG
jgi:hypothetical protein